jgi:hypothetical protein
MNTNVRELKQHVVYEPESYYAAFSAELEICASIMWSLVLHLNDKVRIPSRVLLVLLLLLLLLLSVGRAFKSFEHLPKAAFVVASLLST